MIFNKNLFNYLYNGLRVKICNVTVKSFLNHSWYAITIHTRMSCVCVPVQLYYTNNKWFSHFFLVRPAAFFPAFLNGKVDNLPATMLPLAVLTPTKLPALAIFESIYPTPKLQPNFGL